MSETSVEPTARSAGESGDQRRPRALAFLRSPRWVIGHVVALVAVIAFANLGVWQLRRLDERRAYNALLTERLSAQPVPLEELDATLAQGEQAVAYRRVTVSGAYDAGHEVLLSTRSRDGVPGHHVLTPLVAASGGTVVVDRGWIPLDWGGQPPVAQAPPPEGEVTVEGVLFPPRQARRSGTLDGDPEPLEFMSDVDLGRYAAVTDGAMYPLYVLAQEQRPGQPGGFPAFGDLPVLDEGNHASYAGQWFIFATVVAVGYPILLWRTWRP
ncbi:MAG: SURF1 family cytochrome oxidase biogenesis protein [Egibacteraceae bacterium]|jgi:cytochrome oxidase assembly protein ShyY1